MPAAKSTPTRQRPSPSPSPSSSRSASSSALEILYNTAVQAFVRRDHGKAISTLHKLLDLLAAKPGPSGVWYDLSAPAAAGDEKEVGEWREKVLKLYISSTVSLYSDPKPTSSSELGEDIPRLLPPAAPDVLLSHLQRTCASHSFPSDTTSAILPPSLISTLLLAALKLQPAGPALDFAHRLAEDWISALPDELLERISSKDGAGGDAGERKRTEGAREGYLKVTELFVGEVLVREGEWEMARAFLEGEGVMGSKRKENLYRHIRSAESRPKNRSNPSSPSRSMMLPSPSSSGILPSKSISTASSRNGRSRTSSVSSSSSEATARPHSVVDRLAVPRRSARGRDRAVEGKAKASADGRGRTDEAEDEKEALGSQSTKSSMPSTLYINHSPASSSRVPLRSRGQPIPRSNNTPATRTGASWESLLSLLPKSMQLRVRPIVSNSWLLAAISIPIPLIVVLATILSIRRRILKKRNELLGKAVGKAAEVVVTAGQSTMAVDAMADVRARLKRTRERGAREWMRAWLGWWMRKVKGIWKMGTTITYL